MSYERWQEVINDYEKLLETGEGCDVIINCQDEDVKAHSIILRTRSQYFRRELSRENVEKRNGNFILKKPDVPPQYLTIILRYIYCEKIDLTILQGRDILNLLKFVLVFDIQSLIPSIKDHLIKHQTEFLRQSPAEILENTYQHESLSELSKIGLENICDESELLFK